jgi:hypothetical protein
MRPLLAALALALAHAGCSTSPCQELGERICRCQPGTTHDGCRTQVERRVDGLDPDAALEDLCEARLATCQAPAGYELCEWLLTPDGKEACGLTAPDPAP